MFQIGGSAPPRKGDTQQPKRAPAAPRLVPVEVRLEPRQRDKLALLGGDAWLREQIDRAELPDAEGEG